MRIGLIILFLVLLFSCTKNTGVPLQIRPLAHTRLQQASVSVKVKRYARGSGLLESYQNKVVVVNRGPLDVVEISGTYYGTYYSMPCTALPRTVNDCWMRVNNDDDPNGYNFTTVTHR